MARAALFHLLRSQSKQLSSSSRTFASGYYPRRSGTWPLCPSAKQNFASTIQAAAAQKRWASQAINKEDYNKIIFGPRRGGEGGEEEKDTAIVYHGPLSSAIKKVKLLSLSTSCLSVLLSPVIIFMMSPDVSLVRKGAIAASFIFLSATTTVVLHWFVGPYVHKLRWQPGSDSFDVETLSWLATSIPRTIKFADIQHRLSKWPFVIYKANGKVCLIDLDHCHDGALLAVLL